MSRGNRNSSIVDHNKCTYVIKIDVKIFSDILKDNLLSLFEYIYYLLFDLYLNIYFYHINNTILRSFGSGTGTFKKMS